MFKSYHIIPKTVILLKIINNIIRYTPKAKRTKSAKRKYIVLNKL